MAAKKRRNWTREKEDKFLGVLASGASVTKACDAVAMSRWGAYKHKLKNEAFSKKWEEAVEAGTDRLEDEALRRACEGVDVPVGFFRGEHGGTFAKRHSDPLLTLLLKARRPDKYKDRSEITTHNGDLASRLEEATQRLRNHGRED